MKTTLQDQTMQYVRSLERRIQQLEEERLISNHSKTHNGGNNMTVNRISNGFSPQLPQKQHQLQQQQQQQQKPTMHQQTNHQITIVAPANNLMESLPPSLPITSLNDRTTPTSATALLAKVAATTSLSSTATTTATLPISTTATSTTFTTTSSATVLSPTQKLNGISTGLLSNESGLIDPISGRPEAVVRALQVLEVREQLEHDRLHVLNSGSALIEQMDAGEKALVREMCNVVWRKLEGCSNGPVALEPL